MRMLLPVLLAAGAVSGCAAEFVESRVRRPGPVPEVVLDPGGGHLRYSLKGPSWAVRSRRNDALAKMSQFCGDSKYRILDEVSRDETSATYAGDDLEEGLSKSGRHYEYQKTHHLYFECGK